MNKVTALLIAAGLLITGIMVYLMMTGVSLKERRMVKWSAVASGAEAGPKIAQFFYPLLQERKQLVIVGEGPFANAFFHSFRSRVERDLPGVSVFTGSAEGSPARDLLRMRFQALGAEILKQPCDSQHRDTCLAQRAWRKFQSKDRPESPFWISLYRTSQDHILFYFIENKQGQ
jgi:hypothetical protein